jgi:ABC-type branched-subunit amino acid transport system substrate-binding protein
MKRAHLVVVLVAAAPYAAAQEPIVIGQTIALSGGLAEHGKAVHQGALAYLKKVNAAGGIGGREIVLKTLDDGGDSQRAAENTRKLIEQEHVVAVFGGIEGGPCVASMKVAAEKRVPLVACMAGSPELREPFQRYAFPVRAPHFDEFAKLIDTAAQYGHRRVAFLHSDSDTGRKHLANVQRLLRARGLELAMAIPLASKPDAVKIAQQLKEGGIQAMFNHGSYGVYAEIIRESRKLGLQTQFLAINSGAQQMVRSLNEHASGLIFTQVVPYPWGTVTPVVKEFRDSAKSIEGGISFSAMEGFMSAKVLAEALSRAGRSRKALNPDTLIAALEGMKSYDLGGLEVRFSPTEHKGSDFVDTVVVASDGRFVR